MDELSGSDVGGNAPPIATAETALATDSLTTQAAVFSGFWEPSSDLRVHKMNYSHNNFIAEYDRMWNLGYRIANLATTLISWCRVGELNDCLA